MTARGKGLTAGQTPVAAETGRWRTRDFASVEIDTISVHDVMFSDAVGAIAQWSRDGSGGYVCTPNVDHVVRARRDHGFRSAVMGARLRVPDGMGIIYGSRLAGRRLRGTVTGRLLPQAVGRELAREGAPIALFGGPPGIAERAAARLRTEGVDVADAIGPGLDFRVGSAEDDHLTERLRMSAARVIFVALGAPKQELWMAARSPDLPATVLVGVGAAVDVLAGRVRAAPAWMTRLGLEWFFRLAHEPRRLTRRYLWDDPRFFWWMLRQRISRNRGTPSR